MAVHYTMSSACQRRNIHSIRIKVTKIIIAQMWATVDGVTQISPMNNPMTYQCGNTHHCRVRQGSRQLAVNQIILWGQNVINSQPGSYNGNLNRQSAAFSRTNERPRQTRDSGGGDWGSKQDTLKSEPVPIKFALLNVQGLSTKSNQKLESEEVKLLFFEKIVFSLRNHGVMNLRTFMYFVLNRTESK